MKKLWFITRSYPPLTGGAFFELGVSELNLCNKSSSLKALKKAAKYDRRYRSEVKRIIKKVDAIMGHCQDN